MRDRDRETMAELTVRLDSLLGAFEERSAKGNGQAVELLRGTLNSALAKSGGTGVPLRLFIARPTDAQSWAACVVDVEASIGLEATRRSDGKPFALRAFDVDGNTCVLESTEGGSVTCGEGWPGRLATSSPRASISRRTCRSQRRSATWSASA